MLVLGTVVLSAARKTELRASSHPVFSLRRTGHGLKSITKITLFYNSRRTLRKSIGRLLLPHGIVETARQHEFLMRALLDDCTVLEHND